MPLDGIRARLPALWEQRRVRIAVVAAGAAVGLVLAARYLRKLLKGNDFEIFFEAGEVLRAGGDLYAEAGGYLYPPTLAVLMAPVTALGFTAASVLWLMLTLGALAASLWLCVRAVGLHGREGRVVAALALLCTIRPIDSELGNGQANNLVLLGVALMAWLLVEGRRTWAGVALSFAISLKVTPALFGVYLLYKREWAALAGTAAGLVVFLVLVPALALGPAGALETDRAWLERFVGPLVSAEVSEDAGGFTREQPGHVPGQSLRPMVYRLLTFTDASSHWDDPILLNVASLEPHTAERVYQALSLLMLLTMLVAWSWRRDGDRERRMLEISLCVVTMLLISPLSRKAHFVAAMLPLAVCIARYRRLRDPRMLRWLVPAVLLLDLTSPGFLGKRGSVWALSFGAVFWGGALLWLGLVRENLRSR